MSRKIIWLVRFIRESWMLPFAVVIIIALVPESSFGQTPSGCPQGSVFPPPFGMVAWWSLAETAGVTVSDSSGLGHDGTSMPGPIGSGGPMPVSGFVGSALRFSSGSYVLVPGTGLSFGHGNFSIDAWIKTSSTGPIISHMAASAIGGGYRLYIDTNHKLTFQLGTPLGPATFVGPLVATPQWLFIAVVVRRYSHPAGPAVIFYWKAAGTPGPLSQLVVTNLPPNASASSTTAVEIGKAASLPPGGITIDDLEIFNRIMDVNELTSIFTAGSKGKCWGVLNPL